MRTQKSRCPLVQSPLVLSQTRQTKASASSSLALAKLIFAFALGILSFGGGISAALSLNSHDHAPSHYVAGLASNR